MAFEDSSSNPELPLALERVRRDGDEPHDPKGYKILSVRLRDAEHKCFIDQITEAGMSANLALRVAARRIAGFLETDAETRSSLREISGHISAISRSLMEISQAAARGGQTDFSELSRLRTDFGEKFYKLDARLRTVLNVSERRLDGKALLTKSMRQKHDF